MFAGATTPLGGGGAAGAAGGDIAFVLGVRGWGIPWSCCWRGMCRWDMRVGSKGGQQGTLRVRFIYQVPLRRSRWEEEDCILAVI